MSGDTPEQIVLRTEHHEYLADGLRLLSPERAGGAAAARRGGLAGGGSGEEIGLFQSDGALAHRECAHEVPALYGTEKTVMKHPDEADLALFAGHDLGFVIGMASRPPRVALRAVPRDGGRVRLAAVGDGSTGRASRRRSPGTGWLRR